MANRLRGEASFTDEEFGEITLRLDAPAFLAIEDELGLGLQDMGETGKRLGLAASVLMIAMRGNHPDLGITREEALEVLVTNPDASKALQLAMERAMPKVTEGNPKAGRKGSRAGTGT